MRRVIDTERVVGREAPELSLLHSFGRAVGCTRETFRLGLRLDWISECHRFGVKRFG